MFSQAGLGVVRRLSQRKDKSQKSPSEIAFFVGVNNGFATFRTNNQDEISFPVANVITNQAWTGTFSVVRPKYGYPSVFKEV